MKRLVPALSKMVMVLMLLVSCSSGGGSSSPGTGGTGTDTTAPSMPAGLVAAAASSSAISLSWNGSTDNVAVTGYKIYRGGTQLSTSTANAFSDSGLTSSTTYTYTVAAYDAAGNASVQSSPASATTMAAGTSDTTAPTAPTNLTAAAVSSSKINLSWTASTDSVGVAGYEVWRGTTKITTVTTTSYSDTGLTASTAYTYTVKAFDGANNVSAASSPATATTSAVSGAGSLRIRVVNYHNNRVPNATVVLGNSSGAMVTYGTTDANGEYTFTSPPANATVTAAMSCIDSGTHTNYSLEAIYDVNVPAVTSLLNDCNTNSSKIGTITVNVTSSISGVTSNVVHLGGNSNYGARTTYDIYSDYLQSDGKLSIVIEGRDANGKTIGYGSLLDQTFTSGMSVNINVNQPVSYVQYQLTNIPATVKVLWNDLAPVRKGQQIYLSTNISSSTTSTTLNVPYVPSYGDSFTYSTEAILDQNNNGHDDSFTGLGVVGGTASAPSNQSFDFSQKLTIPSSLAVSNGAGTATPTISWAGTDLNATFLNGQWRIPYSSTAQMQMWFYASSTRTSIVFPELPQSLSAFRPSALDGFNVQNVAVSSINTYSDWLTWMENAIATGRFTYSSGTVSKNSGASYSSSQTLAPVLNKSVNAGSRTPNKWFGL